MTARSFSIPTTVPLTTAPSCTPCPKDSSSILAKSSREGVAELVAVAMQTPKVRSAPDDVEWRFERTARWPRAGLRQPPKTGSPAQQPGDRNEGSGPARHQEA